MDHYPSINTTEPAQAEHVPALARTAAINASLQAEIQRWAGLPDGHPRREAYGLLLGMESVTVLSLLPDQRRQTYDQVLVVLLPIYWDGPTIAAWLGKYAPEILAVAHALTITRNRGAVAITPEGYRALRRLRRAAGMNGVDA